MPRAARLGRGCALGVLAAIAAFVLTFHPSRPLYMRHAAIDVVTPDGIVLAGTLSLPRWAREPVPAMVLVHGSGPLTRADLRGDARALVRRGFGVFAYDKRGAGASGGHYTSGREAVEESALRLLAQDAAAAFERIRAEPGVDPSRIGFFGASQASWIIPLAAERLASPPRFHVVLSGAAVSTGVEEFYSNLTGDGRQPAPPGDPQDIERQVADYHGPIGFDPEPVLRASQVPTLWLLGERDLSVPQLATVRVLDSIRAAGNRSHTVHLYPSVGHDLRDTRTGEPAPLWSDLLAWLRQQGVID
jgi:dienelactone hydrolase